jgi:hypothetical protein
MLKPLTDICTYVFNYKKISIFESVHHCILENFCLPRRIKGGEK